MLQFSVKSVKTFFSRPENVAVTLSLFFGIVFIIIIRPLQIPDEANHFIRAYQVSQGSIAPTKNLPGGCVAEGDELVRESFVTQVIMPKGVVDFTELNRDQYSLREQLARPFNTTENVGVCSRQTQANSPVGYLPQALAIAVVRVFGASAVVMDYAARFAVLLCWTAFIYMSVRVIPVRKWAIVGVALIPMAVQQSISIGADVLSIAPAALFVAIVVRSYYEDRRKYFQKDLVTLSALATLAALSKPVMVVLVMLLAFYRIGKNSRPALRNAYLWKAAAIVMPVVSLFLWSVLAAWYSVSATDIFEQARLHKDYLLNSPVDGVYLFLVQAFRYVFYGMALDQFGAFQWFSVSIPETWRFIGVAALSLMLLVGYVERNQPLKAVPSRQLTRYNLAALATAAGVVGANIFTLFIIWTPLGAMAVEGVQFRYFLPAFFIIAGLIQMRFLTSSERWYRNFIIVNSLVFFVISVLTITHKL